MSHIVPMTAAHVPALAELEQLCFPHPWSEAALLEELHNPQAAFLTAEEDGAPVGYVGLYVAADEAFIADLAVHPSYRRRGIATALLCAATQTAAKKGASRLMLEVRASNKEAQALYIRAGFVKDGVRPRFYTDPTEDAVLFSLNDLDNG